MLNVDKVIDGESRKGEIAPVIPSDAEESAIIPNRKSPAKVEMMDRCHVLGQTLTRKLVPFVERDCTPLQIDAVVISLLVKRRSSDFFHIYVGGYLFSLYRMYKVQPSYL